MCTTQQICLEIYHPAFREGYEFGRCLYFQKRMQVTDKYLVEGLLAIANDPENQQNPRKAYYVMGFAFGLMSACVLPPQIGEEDGKAVEEAFLQKVREKYEANGAMLAQRIQLQWDGSDLLAEKLDALTFVQMLNRGKTWHLFLEDVGEEIKEGEEKA